MNADVHGLEVIPLYHNGETRNYILNWLLEVNLFTIACKREYASFQKAKNILLVMA